MAKSVDPLLHSLVRYAPVLEDEGSLALRLLHGDRLPVQSGTAPYHATLACVFATFLCEALDFEMKARPRRGADLPGYQADLSLIAFTYSVVFLEAVSSNKNQLLVGQNCEYIATILRARRPELARPIETHLAGGDAVQIGAQVSSLAIDAATRNHFKTKVEPLVLTMFVPFALGHSRKCVESLLEQDWADLVAPLV